MSAETPVEDDSGSGPDHGVTSVESQAKEDLAIARDTALRLLARREHSKKELGRKLQLREIEAGTIDAVLAQLADEGLQSDERFAERFAESRAARRYGPVRILGELCQKGVDRSTARNAIAGLPVDWTEVALEALARLRGDLTEFEDRARMSRKLHQRGFPQDTIRQALSLHD